VSAAASATNQNEWIGSMKQQLKKYPNMHLVSTVYGNDDPTTATQVTQGIRTGGDHLADHGWHRCRGGRPGHGAVPREGQADRTKRIKASLFVLSGVMCAAVGMLYAFELSSAGENIGIGFELQVVTIVLLGGVSIFGGTGTILVVALAAFVYAGLRSALLLTSLFNENDFQVVSGGLLILSVLMPNAASFAQRLRAFARRRRA
jgi:hypothetical protein